MLNLEQLHLYQIYYDDLSWKALDAGFIPLDNSANERPDWSEYWPIRNFLKNNELNDNDFYAFLSPKFGLKTQLSSTQLKSFIQDKYHPEVDVFTVSPFWDQAAFFKNIFEQGDFWHPGLWAATQSFLSRVNLDIDLNALITHTQNTVFCNYIVARPCFWRKWVSLVDRLFFLAEAAVEDLGRQLSEGTRHADQTSYPLKVFIQERLATFLLATESFKVVTYDLFHLPTLLASFEPHRVALLHCDALKQAYTHTGHNVFLESYGLQRQFIHQNTFEQSS